MVLVLTASPARAHNPSDAYVAVDLDRTPPALRLDIALRDLEHAVGLDGDGDGRITWGELRARHADVAHYALARLTLTADGGPCVLTPGTQQVAEHGDGAYAVLPLAVGCPGGAPRRLSYRLLFDLDPSHRGLVSIRAAGQVRAAVLSEDRPSLGLEGAGPGTARTLTAYGLQGVRHIWTGFDHLLFLVALLLPSVLRHERGRWRPLPSLAPALRDVLAVVTAFTLAHSITLSLAVLGWVSLPARWVESAIAATVVLAALNNIRPMVSGRRWALAFALGLIHGLGFAEALADLGLPSAALVPALAGFNLGVEAGQIAILALFVPGAYLLRHTGFYQRGALGLGSAAVAAIAFLWLAERSLDIRLLHY